MLLDLHTHSILSHDGSVPLADMARAAESAGLDALFVTDHFDMLTSDGQPDTRYDWQPAIKQFDDTAPKFQEHLMMGLGLEIGSAPFFHEEAIAAIDGASDHLDMVIGSLHNYRPENSGCEYFKDCFDTYEKCQFAMDDYLKSMEELVAMPECYDVLGHIIYPLRYFERDGCPMTLEGYRDQLAAILKQVISTGRSIEVNTNRGKSIEDWRDILLLYKDLGGVLVTTGSDAHHCEDVGKGLSEANELLQQCGFVQIAMYRHRVPMLTPIS